MKKDYCILTDATSDLTPKEISQYDIRIIPMAFALTNKIYQHTPTWSEMSYQEFYRQAATEKVFTSQITQPQFESAFQECFETYPHILCLCCSSGFSGTFNSSQKAQESLQQKFSKRKIYTIDTRTISIGLASLTIKAAKLRESGHTIDQTYEKILATIPHTPIWFTVRDIKGLARSGRCSSLTAFVGNILNLTPVLHVDDNGTIVPVKKVHGHKKALDEIIEKIAKLSAIDPNQQTIRIGNGDFDEATEYLSTRIKNLWPSATIKTSQISPIVGCHTGPGIIGVSFKATTR